MYLIADGKKVGDAIYGAIAAGDFCKASQISEAINIAIPLTRDLLEELGVEVIVAGGDDIFCYLSPGILDVAKSVIWQTWNDYTGLGIDIAWGETPEDALRFLDKEKGILKLSKAFV